MEKIDFKKFNKELYGPKNEPSVVTVPAMNFIMVDGHGNPNDSNGEYQNAIELLYTLSNIIKFSRLADSKKTNNEHFIDYKVAPLEGLWWLNDQSDMDFSQKSKYCWTSMIRQPDFITEEIFIQTKEEARKKKPNLEVSNARFVTFEEGLCVQCMHIGPYDAEPATIAKIDAFIKENGFSYDIGSIQPDGSIRRHHEIYLNDPRKVNPANMKTILRHPVKKIS